MMWVAICLPWDSVLKCNSDVTIVTVVWLDTVMIGHLCLSFRTAHMMIALFDSSLAAKCIINNKLTRQKEAKNHQISVIKLSSSDAFVIPMLSSSFFFAVQRLSDTVLKDIDFLFSLVVFQGHFLNEDYSSSVWSHGQWALSLAHWAFELLRISKGPALQKNSFSIISSCLHQRNIWTSLKQHNCTNNINNARIS